jgi:hypothetical protein
MVSEILSHQKPLNVESSLPCCKRMGCKCSGSRLSEFLRIGVFECKNRNLKSLQIAEKNKNAEENAEEDSWMTGKSSVASTNSIHDQRERT